MGWKSAVEADAIEEQQLIEADTIWEQQLKWTQLASSSRNHGAAAEADAIREHAAAEVDSCSS